MSNSYNDSLRDDLLRWMEVRKATPEDIYTEKGLKYVYNRILGVLEPLPEEYQELL